MAWRVDDGVAADAVSVWTVLDPDDDVILLPEWYQPSAMRRTALLTGWPRRIAIATVIAFIAIDAFGLCSTYGHIVFA
ncbi:MAG: hypothetical protein QOK28_1514 [Actinomycetota bacterium]|jgi:hypothetical protein